MLSSSQSSRCSSVSCTPLVCFTHLAPRGAAPPPASPMRMTATTGIARRRQSLWHWRAAPGAV